MPPRGAKGGRGGGSGGAGGAVREVDVQLVAACQAGDVANAQRAIAAGARLDVDVDGGTPLMWACNTLLWCRCCCRRARG